MGKIQCTSTKSYKNHEFYEQFNKNNKSLKNIYEFELTTEYNKLKEYAEDRKKGPFVENMFGLNDYKKQLNRLLKWGNIALKKLPSNYYEQKQNKGSNQTSQKEVKFSNDNNYNKSSKVIINCNELKLNINNEVPFSKSCHESDDEDFQIELYDMQNSKENESKLDYKIKLERNKSIKTIMKSINKRTSELFNFNNHSKAKKLFDKLILSELNSPNTSHIYREEDNYSIKKSRQYTSKFHQFDEQVEKHNIVLKKDLKEKEGKQFNVQTIDFLNTNSVLKSALKKKIEIFQKEIKIEPQTTKNKHLITFKHDASGPSSAFNRRYSGYNNLEVNSFKKDYNNKILSDGNRKGKTLNSDNSSSFVNSFIIDEIEGITKDQVEYNLRSFHSTFKNKFCSRVVKGPPNPFRWISWMIVTGVPEKRDEELYNLFYLSYISDEAEVQIKRDLNRTIPETMTNLLTQKEISIMEFSLYKVLRAFAANDSDVAYCQGINYIANFLLFISNFNEVESFYMMLALFSNTFTNSLGIRGFYTQGFLMLNFYSYLFHQFLEEHNPRLRYHIVVNLEMKDEFWIGKWFMTLFTIIFPYEVVSRIWDYILIHGLEFIIKFTIALLQELETKILRFEDAIDLLDFFKILSIYDNSSLINSSIFNKEKQYSKIESRASILSGLPNYYRINLDEVLNQATKIIFSRDKINIYKNNYEKENKVSLSELNIKYNLDKSVLNTPDISLYREYYVLSHNNTFYDQDYTDNNLLKNPYNKDILKFRSVSEKSATQEHDKLTMDIEKAKSGNLGEEEKKELDLNIEDDAIEEDNFDEGVGSDEEVNIEKKVAAYEFTHQSTIK